jgi:ABC-2 type transport system ATP-binding protein
MSNAIEADQLVKTYGPVRALDGLSFAAEQGTVFALLGPNGAGKSTAVKILTTLTRADSGSARVAGIDVREDAAGVRRAIGVVAQGTGIDEDLTGRENVMLQGHVYGLRGDLLRTRTRELLERFGLSEAADRSAREYSGGMQRRHDIAGALVHRPSVLFLDEPTTGLDPEVRAAMWGVVSRLANEEGISVLLTTHYLEEADTLAAQVAIVDRGRIVARGTPEALKGELRGDAIQVELREPPGDGLDGTLAGVPGVGEAILDGRVIRARVDDGARAVPTVLGVLERAGLEPASVTVARPSLDDVYFNYTGRAFAEADSEGERHDENDEVSR